MERPRLLLAGIVTATLLTLAACGGSPAAPALTDPTEILKAAVSATSTATSFHLDVSADGQVSLDLMGAGVAAPINFAGSTAAADVDMANGDGRVTFSVPGLLGLAGEIIALDGTAYVKTTITGPLYQKQSLGDVGSAVASPDPSTVASMLDELEEALAQPGVDPVKGDDVPCGTTTCYTVSIELTPEELAALGADDLPVPNDLPIPVPDLGSATIDATFRVAKDTNRLAGATLEVGFGDDPTTGAAGEITAELTFSKWNEPVSISAPPADQIAS